MSGENIYQLLGQHQPAPDAAAVPTTTSPYTGEYDLHMGEPGKPAYSTFFEKGKEYDGTNVRFYRQRHAVIGRNIAPEVDPKNFLRRGEGIRSIVPPIHEEKVFRNPPVDHGNLGKNAFGGNGGGNGGQGPNGGDNGAGNGPDGLGGAGGNLSGAGGALGGGADGFSRGGAYGQSGTGFGGPFDAEKDFITSNIVEVSNMVPKRRKEQPSYATDRKDFGQVPAYLERVKSEISHEKQFFQNMDQRKLAQKEQVLKHYVFRLSEEEHRHLVAKLKRKLDEKTSAYNKMPMAQDSLMVSKRKGELETSIRDIETALKKLDREVIFVYRDDPVNGQWTKNAALEEAKKYCLEA